MGYAEGHREHSSTEYFSIKSVYVASLTALAIVLKLRIFEIPYPFASFLKYDLSGVPLAIIALISLRYIPVSLLIYFLLHIAMGADAVGMAMKCLAETSTIIPLVLVLKKIRSCFKHSSLIAIMVSIISRTGVMAFANYIVTPHWLLWARLAESFEIAHNITIGIMPHIIIFNISLGLIVSALTISIYKTLSKAGFVY